MSKKDTKFGSDLMQALKEVQAHRRGEIALPLCKLEVPSSILMTVIKREPDVMKTTFARGRVS